MIESEAFAKILNTYLLGTQEYNYWHVTQQSDGSIRWQSADESLDTNPNYGDWYKLPD